jgi:quinol monooxygenase YgiN
MAIVILGRIEVRPDWRERLLQALQPVVAKTRAEEPGCLTYAFSADTVDENLLVVIEHWADEASLAAHFEHPNMAATRKVLKDNGAGTSAVRKYEVDDGDPVKDAEGRYRADFFTGAGAE